MSEELSKADLLRYARDTYLFEGLEEELVQGLLDDLSLVCLAPGENLFRQGEESDSSYLVIDGTIDVAMEQSDGKEHFVGEVAPGSGSVKSGCSQHKTDWRVPTRRTRSVW